MKTVYIDEERRADFGCVLPKEMTFGSQCILLGAVDEEGRAAGALAVSEDPEQYSIEWIYVDPKARRQGVGAHLMAELDKMINTVGIKPLRCTFAADEEGALFAFFHSFDRPGFSFEITFSHNRYKVPAKDFMNSPRLEEEYGLEFDLKEFFTLSKEIQKELLRLVSDRYVIADLEEWEAACEKPLCVVAVKKGAPKAFLIVQKQGGRVLELSFLYSSDPKAVYYLLQTVAMIMQEEDDKYGESEIVFDTPFPESEVMARKFFENANVSHIYEAELL